MRKQIETVRFQVPVPEDLAKAIESLATEIDRSSAWLAVQLLEFTLDDYEKFCDWMMLTFLGTAYDTIKRIAGRRTRALSQQSEVRLQLNAPAVLIERISKLAVQWNQTPVKTAGLLLAAGAHHHEVFLDAIALGKRLAKRTQSHGHNGLNPA